MVNKDYILRNIEQFTRHLTILLGLRQRNTFEEALIYVDNLYLQTLGLTSRFVHSVSEEMLLHMISPLGGLDVEKCLWLAVLLKAEGEIYEDMGNESESYYRYLKSLHLFLAAFSHEKTLRDVQLGTEVVTLLDKLEDYELPVSTIQHLFVYYELNGQYDKAENTLFDMFQGEHTSTSEREQLREQGREFYARLLKKSDADLFAGNLSRVEIEESMEQLKYL